MDEWIVEFDEAVYSLHALNAAAYRLIDVASCRIEKSDGKYLCRLTVKDPAKHSVEHVRQRLIDGVTDEGLRERLAAQTEPVRNLILSLAFGSLALQADGSSK